MSGIRHDERQDIASKDPKEEGRSDGSTPFGRCTEAKELR